MTRRGRGSEQTETWPSGRATRIVAVIAATLAVSASASAATNTVIRSANDPSYGRILKAPNGFTIYVFCAGTQTHCTGRRSRAWLPLIATSRIAAARHSQIRARKLGTRKLRNGKRQVTYYGQPLYLYKGDHKRQQASGEDTQQGNGAWFVISTTGRPVPPPSY